MKTHLKKKKKMEWECNNSSQEEYTERESGWKEMKKEGKKQKSEIIRTK